MKPALLLMLAGLLMYSSPAGEQRYLASHLNQTKQVEGETSVIFRTTPENNYWMPKGEKDEFYLYVFLNGQKHIPQERVPINLSLVVDRSGSMRGDKIDYAKKALDYVIDQLGQEDRISIVQYDDGVEVVCPPQPVKNRAQLHQLVQGIQPDGATNLSGGMEKGFELVNTTKKSNEQLSNYIHRVILLSDGQANEGITDPRALRQIVNKQFNSNGITLSTFGVGAGFNEDLMTGLATEGGANYQFIGSPDQLPQVFNKELSGMVSVVAKNTELQIEFPSNLVSCQKVHLYPYKVQGNKINIQLNDLFSEQQKAILIKFKVKKRIKKNMEFISQLTYNNTVNGFSETREIHKTTVQLTDDEALYENAHNPEAGMGHALMVGGEKFQESMQQADRNKFEDARKLLREAKNIMEAHFERVEPHPFLWGLYEDMKKYGAEIDELEKMKKDKSYRGRRKFSLRQKRSKARTFRTISCPSF